MEVKRDTYIMTDEEVFTLTSGVFATGIESVINKMKARAIFSMKFQKDLDEMLLDMSETLLQKGKAIVDIEKSDNPGRSMVSVYYTLARSLRKLAHDVHRMYQGQKRENMSDRFLEIIYNPEAPKQFCENK